MENYKSILEQIHNDVKPLFGKGAVANYIPALAEVNPMKFGMAIKLVTGEEFVIGDSDVPFSIQSISKVLTLTLYIKKVGLELGDKIGVEPSGNPFNSLVQLEYEKGKPRNPFINAGALLITDSIISIYGEAKQLILDFIHEHTDNKAINYNYRTAVSEIRTSHRNAALLNFMKSYGMIDNPIKEVLDSYCHHCALDINCLDMARLFLYLANNGRDINGKEVISMRETKRINALMLTCGTYDNVGEFAYKVGLPAKSGVGGGIIASVPGKMSIAVWSPALNTSGNSVIGTKALELFTTYTGLSIF